MHGVCLFVCLFPIQIGAAARCAVKRAMHAEGRLGRVLRGPACDYLPCGRLTCEVFFGWRPRRRRPHDVDKLIYVMRSPVAGRKRLETFRDVPLREARGTCS